jgi:DNA-binding beta-propeller fold protein YncE
MVRNRKCVLSIVFCLSLAGVAFGQVDDTYVFLSDPDNEQILRIDTTDDSLVVLYEEAGSFYHDLALGPDGNLYAADALQRVIIRFDPNGTPPMGISDAEVVYNGVALAPEGLRFIHWRGGLLFTDANGSGLWLCEGIADTSLATPVNTCDAANTHRVLDATAPSFGGAGVSQSVTGDALAVDRNAGTVYEYPMNQFTGSFDPSQPINMVVTGLSDPIGAAVNAHGDIFVASADGGVLRFPPAGGNLADADLCVPLKKQLRAQYLEFRDDDTLFVAATSKSAGQFYTTTVNYDPDGSFVDCAKAKQVIDAKKSPFETAVGVAVAAGFEFEQNGKPTFDTVDPPLDRLFTFFDHAYQVSPIPAGCDVSITANEVPHEEICNRIRDIENKPAGINIPPCLSATVDQTDGIHLDPVVYLGNSFPELYTITPTGDCDSDGINHILSAFTHRLRTPQLVRCDNDGTNCSALPLNFVAPNDGAIPQDGTFGGFTPTFSEYFLVDDQDNPLNEQFVECVCPIDQFSVLPDDAPSYSPGSTIPLRVHVLKFDFDHSTGEPVIPTEVSALCTDGVALANACHSGSAGDYVTEFLTILLSLARIEEGFEPVVIEAGGNDQEQPPYLSAPNSINASSWTYQLKAPAGTGLHKAILFFVDREIEFAPEADDPISDGFVERFLQIQ